MSLESAAKTLVHYIRLTGAIRDPEAHAELDEVIAEFHDADLELINLRRQLEEKD